MFRIFKIWLFLVLTFNFLAADEKKRVYVANPPLLYSVYALDKEVLIGINFSFANEEKKYLDEKVANLPVLGGWFGQGKTPNLEMILKVNPNIILISEFSKKLAEPKLNEFFKEKKIYYIKDKTMQEMADSFLILGEILEKNERAKELNNWSNEALKIAKNIKDKNISTKIYYAEGNDGLATECSGSSHIELIELIGAKNVHQCEQNSGYGANYGMHQISFEQVLNYNPDVILVFDKNFYSKVFNDLKWKNLNAVKNKKVYLIPKAPFSWFDRPPSFMRFLGIKWLVSILYKDVVAIDLNKEVKEFYKLFLNIDLNDKQISEILNL